MDSGIAVGDRGGPLDEGGAMGDAAEEDPEGLPVLVLGDGVTGRVEPASGGVGIGRGLEFGEVGRRSREGEVGEVEGFGSGGGGFLDS